MNSSTRHIFRVRDPLPLLRPAALACLVALAVVFFTLEDDGTRGTILLILGGVLLFSLAVCYWLLTRTHLEITPQEIIYHAIGYRVRSSWDNLAGWGKRVNGAAELDSLILREPGMELSGWMRLCYQLLPFMNAASLVTGQGYHPNQLNHYSAVIPIAAFDTNWYTGEIGSLIKQYAPQAYDTPL